MINKIETHVLKLSCRDQIGIVSKISTLLANSRCNIVESKQFTDQKNGNFFIRQSFQLPNELSIETINKEFKNLSNILTDENNQIFHAGTYEKNNKIYSNGGRVLNVTSSSENLIEARDKSLNNIDKINWLDGFCRKDIGWRAISNK